MAALIRIPPERRAWLKAEALRRLVACPEDDWQRLLLCECVQAYLPLEGPQLAEFEHLLVTERYAGIRPMATTWFEQGLEEGLLKGQRRTLLLMLEKRFGPLSPESRARLESWPKERLDEVTLALVDARSLEELGLGEDRPA